MLQFLWGQTVSRTVSTLFFFQLSFKCCLSLFSKVRNFWQQRYPNGGYYRRHLDALPGTPQALRKFSFLLYLNEGWQASDGGCLRIHTDGGGECAPPGAAPSFVDAEDIDELNLVRYQKCHLVIQSSPFVIFR